MTHRLLTRGPAATDTLGCAQRLAAIASDMMRYFVTGSRVITIDGISETLTVTGEFREARWGRAVQFAARDERGDVAAAAEASVILNERGTGSIASRVRQFRTAEVVWTHTGEPVDVRAIRPVMDSYTATFGEIAYRLDKRLDSTSSDALKTVWVLSSTEPDAEPIRFAGLIGAATYLGAQFAGSAK